jgi:MarR family transcriptional regulator, 2-MHQ and catechol-resistance regulon repressor
MSRTRDGSLSGVRSLRKPALLGWLRLMRVYQKVDRASGEQLKGWALSGAQFDVLAHVGASEGMTQQELADSLLVTKGNVCQLLDKLGDRGLISRRHEGRANRLFLTEAGRRVFDEVVPAHEAVIADRFSVLSEEEQARLHELLRRFDKALD